MQKAFTRNTIHKLIDEIYTIKKQAILESKRHKLNKVQVKCTLFDKEGTLIKEYLGFWKIKDLKNDMYRISEGSIVYSKNLGY
jgi:hypothetical protein